MNVMLFAGLLMMLVSAFGIVGVLNIVSEGSGLRPGLVRIFNDGNVFAILYFFCMCLFFVFGLAVCISEV